MRLEIRVLSADYAGEFTPGCYETPSADLQDGAADRRFRGAI